MTIWKNSWQTSVVLRRNIRIGWWTLSRHVGIEKEHRLGRPQEKSQEMVTRAKDEPPKTVGQDEGRGARLDEYGYAFEQDEEAGEGSLQGGEFRTRAYFPILGQDLLR